MSLTIRFDTTALTKAAERLATLDTQTLRQMREAAVEQVSTATHKTAKDEALRQLNLPPGYVNDAIARQKGPRQPLLTRDTVVSEVRGTTLPRFIGARINTVPVNWSNERIADLPRKFGRWPGWTRRKGDAMRGIPEGQKAAGFTVDVNRKGDKTINGVFTLPLKTAGGFGVFRPGPTKNKPVHLYGPSPFQVFRRHINDNRDQIMTDLEASFLQHLDAKLRTL